MMQFTKPSTKSCEKFANALLSEAPQKDRVYDEYDLKGIFIEEPLELINNTMRSYW